MLLWAAPASAAIANAQNDKRCSIGSGTSCAITVTALTAGNVVVVGAVTNESTTLTVAATNVSFTTIHNAIDHSSGGVSLRVYMWVGIVDSAGATTVTITSNVSAATGGWASEFSGVATSGYLDQTDTGESISANTTHDTCSLVTSTAATLLVVVSGSTSTIATWTAGTNYTLTSTVSNRAGGEYRVVAITGTYTCSITQSSSTEAVQVMAALKALESAGGNNGARLLLGVGE